MISPMYKYEKKTININSSGVKTLIASLEDNCFIAFQPHYRQDGTTLPQAWCRYTIGDGIYGSDEQFISLWTDEGSGRFHNMNFCPKGGRVEYSAPSGDRVTVTIHVWYVYAKEIFLDID